MKPTTSPTILLVDDDTDLLHLMKATLEKDGHRVETLTDAPSHEDLVRLHPSLIFMDVELGLENGAAICRALKHDPAVGGPVVLISGHADELLRSMADIGGADAFLTKPFKMRELREQAAYYTARASH